MLLSYVVPAYNAQDTIDACLASICASPSADFEVVCVDDGSTDGTVRLLDEWTDRDLRVRVAHRANGGVSAARNAGIAMAQGDYLGFVDADDRMLPGGTDAMLATCASAAADVITFGAQAAPADAASGWLTRHIAGASRPPEPFTADQVLGEATSPFVWAHAVRRTVATERGARFDETLSLGEDLAFLAACMARSSLVASVPDVVYEYRLERPGSLMAQSDRGSATQLGRHVDVVRSVYDDWASLGIDRKWASQLANWAIRYVVYAILRDRTEARAQQALRVRDLWRRHGVAELSRRFPAAVRGVVRVIEAYGDDGRCGMPESAVSRACLAWRLREYGVRDLVETALGREGTRSGSGC
jgi:glycosyltransferase involved in cell wall biosynthesis